MTAARRSVVVGAGMIGICIGLALQERGWSVTLVDWLEPGMGCSFGNAGILASMAVVSVSLPGFARQVPRMLLDLDSPLVVRWSSWPHTLPWLLRFRRAATSQQVPLTASAMKAPYGRSVELHRALAQKTGVPELVRGTAGLYVHRDARSIDVFSDLPWQLRRARGAEIEVLEGAALRDAEPALSSDYTRSVRMGPMGFTTNRLRLAQACATFFCTMGRPDLVGRNTASAARGRHRGGADIQ